MNTSFLLQDRGDRYFTLTRCVSVGFGAYGMLPRTIYSSLFGQKCVISCRSETGEYRLLSETLATCWGAHTVPGVVLFYLHASIVIVSSEQCGNHFHVPNDVNNHGDF